MGGRLVAVVVFDPDDRRAASAELFERYARSDAARWVPASVIEFWRAMHDRVTEPVAAHEWPALHALMSDDFEFVRQTHFGTARAGGGAKRFPSACRCYATRNGLMRWTSALMA